jgi:hypothetical protein
MDLNIYACAYFARNADIFQSRRPATWQPQKAVLLTGGEPHGSHHRISWGNWPIAVAVAIKFINIGTIDASSSITLMRWTIWCVDMLRKRCVQSVKKDIAA